MRRLLVLPVLLVVFVVSGDGQTTDPDRWRAFQYFVGDWTGEESTSFGEGRGERSYEFILRDRYLLSRNRSVFPPQNGLPRGDVHEDWMVFSYDEERETFVVRQFNSEGFINTFVLQDNPASPQRMVFVLESSENAPGVQASLIYERWGADVFEEVFSMTMPGATDAMTIQNRWTRVPAP